MQMSLRRLSYHIGTVHPRRLALGGTPSDFCPILVYHGAVDVCSSISFRFGESAMQRPRIRLEIRGIMAAVAVSALILGVYRVDVAPSVTVVLIVGSTSVLAYKRYSDGLAQRVKEKQVTTRVAENHAFAVICHRRGDDHRTFGRRVSRGLLWLCRRFSSRYRSATRPRRGSVRVVNRSCTSFSSELFAGS